MPPGSIEVWPDPSLMVLGLIRATVMWKPRTEVTQPFGYEGGVSNDQALGAVAQFPRAEGSPKTQMNFSSLA